MNKLVIHRGWYFTRIRWNCVTIKRLKRNIAHHTSLKSFLRLKKKKINCEIQILL